MDNVETTASSWTRVLTKAGVQLLANAKGKIYYVSHGAAGGEYLPKEELEDLTAVAGHLVDLDIVDERYTDQEDVAEVRLQLDNKDIKETLFVYSIGVYAQLLDKDTQEPLTDKTLMMVLQVPEGEPPDIIRQTPLVTEYIVHTLISQTADVVFNINHGAYVTVGLFRDLSNSIDINIHKHIQIHNEDPAAHPGIQCDIKSLARLQPTAHIATIEHQLDGVPLCTLYRTDDALGTLPYGEGPYGGGGRMDTPYKFRLLPGRRIEVYATPQFAELGTPAIIWNGTHQCNLVFDGSRTNLIVEMRE